MSDTSNKVTPQPSPEIPITLIPDKPTTIGTISIPNAQPSTSRSTLQETFDKLIKGNIIPLPQEVENRHGQ